VDIKGGSGKDTDRSLYLSRENKYQHNNLNTNTNAEDTASKVLVETKNMLETGQKTILITKWQRTWLMCVLQLDGK
jgi:hypothetical protein